ncbi:MAG: hypothetical protein KAI79_18605 [Bacteroidales bacterium]|nr:hypothetical protein [Bacteroidales bacterium]
MNYNDFLDQKSIYDEIIEKRITEYLEIAQTERDMYSSTNEEKITTFFKNRGASEYLSEGPSNEHIDYGYEIELEFDIHYSGCGTDIHTIHLPQWILEKDDEYQIFLNDYANTIHDKNQEIEYLINEQKMKEALNKKEASSNYERKEYERLKKKYEEK